MSPRWICLWAMPILMSVLLPAVSAEEKYVWLESEQPTRANVEVKTDEYAGDARLSGQKWLKVARDAEEIAQKWPTGRRTAGVRFHGRRKPGRTRRGTASAWRSPARRSSGASTREHGRRSRRTCSPAT